MPEETQQQIKPTSNDISPRIWGTVATIDGPSKIVSVTWENFQEIKPQWLMDDGLTFEIGLFVIDICDSNDITDMQFVTTKLSQLITQNPNLPTQRPDLYREYLRMFALLKANAISALTDIELEEFFRQDLLFTLEASDFDLIDRMKELFSLAKGFPIRIEDQRNKIIQAIEANQDLLGTESIRIPGFDEEKGPSVRNWLKDYLQFTASNSASPQNKRTAFERAAFISKSGNVKTLSEDEKNILIKLLEIYDWLKFESSEPEVIEKVLPKTNIPIPVPAKPIAFSIPDIAPVSSTIKPTFESKVVNTRTTSTRRSISADELKREVAAAELVAPKEELELTAHEEIASSPAAPRKDISKVMTAVFEKPKVDIVPPLIEEPILRKRVPHKEVRIGGLASLEDIRVLEDLKKVGISNLRQGPLATQVTLLKSKIIDMAEANHLLPFYGVNAFEQSPLFESYLQKGSSRIIEGQGESDLSQEEFEALADLRKEIEIL